MQLYIFAFLIIYRILLQLLKAYSMKIFQIISKFLLILGLILLIPSCAINPVTGKKQLMFMSEAQEVSLGAQYDPTVVSTFGVYDNPVSVSYTHLTLPTIYSV